MYFFLAGTTAGSTGTSAPCATPPINTNVVQIIHHSNHTRGGGVMPTFKRLSIL